MYCYSSIAWNSPRRRSPPPPVWNVRPYRDLFPPSAQQSHPGDAGHKATTKQVVTKVITVVETVVDGKVVESSKTVDVDVDEIES